MFQIEAIIPADVAEALEEYLYALPPPPPWMVQQARDEDPFRLFGWFESEDEARLGWAALCNDFPSIPAEPKVTVLADCDWKDAYKAHFKPWSHRGLHWIPEWERGVFVPPVGEAALHLDPGMAFGTGDHPTTRLCAEAVLDARDLWQGTLGGRRVSDAGCGSGILALSAAALGFGVVDGFDNDPEAVRISKENADLNGLGRRVRFFDGDLNSGFGGRTFDLVLANILAHVLCAHSELLLKAVAPGGILALSGILDKELAATAEHFTREAARLGIAMETKTAILGEWGAVYLKRQIMN